MKSALLLWVGMTEEFPLQTLEGIQDFISSVVDDAGASGVVVGLSGGIDSALVSRLCADALGGKKVLNIHMPSDASPREDGMLTESYSRSIGSDYRVVPIQGMVDAFDVALGLDDRLERGNVMARCRMTVLYHFARAGNLLVMGTGNKSELLMGYFTKHGDGACDALPIGNLYKTNVWRLAKHLDLPQEIITRAPSADLWEGQSDEDEMGISYEELDIILQGIQDSTSPEEIAEGLEATMARVMDIEQRVAANRHKRHSPPMPGV